MDQNSLVPQHIKPQTMLQFHSARRGANNGLFMKVHVRDHREFILFGKRQKNKQESRADYNSTYFLVEKHFFLSSNY